jgi:DNA-binding MarR family transcriptional regulator
VALEFRGPFLLLFATDQQLARLLQTAMVDAPLRPDEFAVTSALRLTAPVRPSELAEITGLRPTTLSNYLRRFEGSGLVRRRRDPLDGRASLLTLTAKGLRRTEACFPAFEHAIGTFRKALVEEGVPEKDVLDTLESVSRALAAATRRLESEA